MKNPGSIGKPGWGSRGRREVTLPWYTRDSGMSMEYALQYAARGWYVFPVYEIFEGKCACGRECASPGKHPRVKGGFKAATIEREGAEAWWTKWPQANVGIATGSRSGLLVLDTDGREGIEKLKAELGQLPPTLLSFTGRGVHLLYKCTEYVKCSSGGGLEVRGDGGYVVAPPSVHVSGKAYRWGGGMLAEAPERVIRWANERSGGGQRRERHRNSDNGTPKLAARIQRAMRQPDAPAEDVSAALAVIPNADLGWDEWNRIGMAAWAASGGEESGREALREWSKKSKKHDDDDFNGRWEHFAKSPPNEIGFGALVFEARKEIGGWLPPSKAPREVKNLDPSLGENKIKNIGEGKEEKGKNGHPSVPALLPSIFNEGGAKENPLIELNNKHVVVSDMGGKCLVMSWVRSDVDAGGLIPSFQSFKSFSERYANRYIMVKKEKKGEEVEEAVQLGAHWLKWTGRRTCEGLGLVPGGPEILPRGEYNLWRGFGVVCPENAIGWPLMREHVEATLAAGDTENAAYIIRWAAWAVQNPGERAEVALVFRGGKGTGKGTFGHAMRRIFGGTHGLHIVNGRHLTGTFNAHLRGCCLLFADEAFWAGDKAGESTLKGLITEPTLFIEQKGIDGSLWKNHLHVIMAANADWAVPASHDERRYVAVDVSDNRVGDRKYFTSLNAEMDNGGLGAMLRDLLAMDLRGWHPREIVHTDAMQEQKEWSMSPVWSWYANLLQLGKLPFASKENPHVVSAATLLKDLQEQTHGRAITAIALGRFLHKAGCQPVRTESARMWQFPLLPQARADFVKKFGKWPFDDFGAWG